MISPVCFVVRDIIILKACFIMWINSLFFFYHSINKWIYCKYKANILINIVFLCHLASLWNYLLLLLVRFFLTGQRLSDKAFVIFASKPTTQSSWTEFTKYTCIKDNGVNFYEPFKIKELEFNRSLGAHVCMSYIFSVLLLFFLLENCSCQFIL